MTSVGMRRTKHNTAHEQPRNKQLLHYALAVINRQESMGYQWQLQWQWWAPGSRMMGNWQWGMGNE